MYINNLQLTVNRCVVKMDTPMDKIWTRISNFTYIFI